MLRYRWLFKLLCVVFYRIFGKYIHFSFLDSRAILSDDKKMVEQNQGIALNLMLNKTSVANRAEGFSIIRYLFYNYF